MPFLMQDRERRAVLALQAAVRELPSTMARLVFLSDLRDPSSGVYRHAGVSRPAEGAELDRIARRLHQESFARWLNYGLEEQKADLDLYFSGLDCPKATVLEAWLELESYRMLVPASASPPERQLFFSDLEAILELMVSELGLARRPGEAEQPVTNEALVTTKEISGWLRVPARTLRFWAEIGKIPAIKIGQQWRFRREAVREWLRRRREGE